jgi:UPF0755 protein
LTEQLDLGMQHDDRPHRRGGPAAVVAVSVVLLVLLVAVAVVGARVKGLIGPAPDWSGTGTGQVVVQVHPGDTATDIGITLKSAGVVRSVEAFRDAAKNDNRSRSIGAGFYRLHRHMRASAALALLLDPASLVRSRVVVPEGFTVEQTLARIASSTEIKPADLEAVAKQPAALGLPAYAKGLEGFLYPATYDFAPGTTATQALTAMVQRWQQSAADLDLPAAAAAAHISPFEAVVVASLVEREARIADDYPKVARVIYNRLAKGMKLQLDSTVNYALHANKTYVTNEDTKVASPYNTYLHPGLPPGPICSPGERALLAALHPARGGWLYFVTLDKAGHNGFATTYDEFLKLKAQGEKNR